MSQTTSLLAPIPYWQATCESGAAYVADSGLLIVAASADVADLLNAGCTLQENESVNQQDGTIYALAASDSGKTLYFTSASDVTLNVPAGLGNGFQCTIIQGGAGTVTPTAVGTAIHNRNSYTGTAGQYACIGLIAVVEDVFILVGDGA